MDEKIEKVSLKNRTIKGVIWSAFDSLSGLLVQMVCSLVVARMLTPEDFGLVGMITVFSAVGLIIIDSGFGQALIRKQNPTQTDFSSVFFFNILMAIMVYGLLYMSSPLIEKFYNIPGLCNISRAVFLIIPINALGLIQNTLLTKKVDFKKLSVISFIAALISGFIGIILAYRYRSVWAIVVQMTSQYMFRTVLLWLSSKWRPMCGFSIASIKEMFPYASNLMMTGLLGTIVNNISPIVIGKVYSAVQLGYYSQADKLQKLPSTTSTSIIQRVTFPILVELQDDNNRLKGAYLRILSQAVYFISPIMVFVGICANEIISFILGIKWLISAYYLQILCISGLLYPISCLSLNLINVKGNSRLLFYLEILRKSIFIAIILTSMFFSIDVFIWMQALYAVIQFFINIYFSGKQITLSVFSQLKVAFPLITISLLCSLPILLTKFFSHSSNIISLILYLFIYAAMYLFLSKKLCLKPFQECLSLAFRLKKNSKFFKA